MSHQAEIATVDRHEPTGWVTYQFARCSCGWRSDVDYVQSRAVREMEDHLSTKVDFSPEEEA